MRVSQAIRLRRDAYRALGKAFEAMETGDVVAFQREATQAAELEIKAQEDLAACISSVGYENRP